MKKLKNIFLYGGLEKSQYQEISAEIDESNRKSIVIMSGACAFVYFFRLCILFGQLTCLSRVLLFLAVISFTVIASVNHWMKTKRRLVHFSAYFFLALCLAVGIISAISRENIQERTALFLVFVVSAPMMFALNIIELASILVPAEIIYLVLIAIHQSNYAVYMTNQGNSLFFSITGIFLGVYMSNMKISGIYHTYMNLRMEEIKLLNEELSQSRKDLQMALAAAEHANRAKTTFLNNMSHDIRTPMNAIIGFTSLAATHIDNQEQVQGYLGKIMTSSQHLLSLINDVLDMSRIESGKVKIEEKPVHLPDVLHDIRTIIQSGVSAKRLDLFIDTEDVRDENIIADKLRLNQILLNLLTNSIKFTKTGGMITVRVIQKQTAPVGYADYEFHVRDNGIGISEEFKEHIFEAFSRENSTTVSGIQGTGLGMAITKNIVDMMGGTITVRSQEGKGTEFIVALRFAINGETVRYEKISYLQGLRALVADDDTNTCLNIGRMLREIGMRAEWTISGKEAVIRAKDAFEQGDEFSVYIIDWLMPDMNGIETVRRIRRVIGNKKPIIILTAYDWSDIEEEAREAGVTAFVSKPLFMSELRDVLSRPFCVEKESEQEDVDLGPVDKKILLVEDNLLNQEIAQTILQEYGFLVDVADDGTEAVEKVEQAQTGEYDLILMDIQMPKMNGYDATRKIREITKDEKYIPIIAMSANVFDRDKNEALEAGMDGYIAKPIEIRTFLHTLNKVMGLQQEENKSVGLTKEA